MLGICSSKCPSNWELIDGTCYGIIKKFTSFNSAYDARESCLHWGGDISDILNHEIYDRILAMIRRVHPIVRIQGNCLKFS